MIKTITDRVILNNGVEMPWLGLGLYKSKNGIETVNAIKTALNYGYRSFDTASFYGNEESVGQAIHDSSISRKDLFLTTKVWNSEQGFIKTKKAFETSLNKLELDYIDLYLIHWPVKGKYIETWKAIEELYLEGYVRAIGVCNFTIKQLEHLIRHIQIAPTVNQVEFHPLLYQKELLDYCSYKKIQLEAWRPLTKGIIFKYTTIQSIAKKYNKTPAQILLRWDLQHEVITIPKSVTPARILENSQIFDFVIHDDDMEKINLLHEGRRLGPDPENVNF